MRAVLASLSRRIVATNQSLVRLYSAANPRSKRYDAFDAHLDKDALTEARDWFKSFNPSTLPGGVTTYARSSGPGGQHVNKYEPTCNPPEPPRPNSSLIPEQKPRPRASIMSRISWPPSPKTYIMAYVHPDTTLSAMILSPFRRRVTDRGPPTPMKTIINWWKRSSVSIKQQRQQRQVPQKSANMRRCNTSPDVLGIRDVLTRSQRKEFP